MYHLDATRQAGPEIQEGFLVAKETAEVRPIVAGIAILPRDLARHLRDHGNVYWRTPLADSRIARFILGRAGRGTDDFVPFDEVVGRYGDLSKDGILPEVPATAPQDEALAKLLAAHAPDGGVGLDIGCGVGRGAFVLRAYVDQALGVDRSAARVRRARNVATTNAAFFLPGPPDSGIREVPVDLDRLDREGVDFLVAGSDALPLADDIADVVVLRAGDGRGPWPDAAAALAEATRVAREDALFVLDASFASDVQGMARLGEAFGLHAWRRP